MRWPSPLGDARREAVLSASWSPRACTPLWRTQLSVSSSLNTIARRRPSKRTKSPASSNMRLPGARVFAAVSVAPPPLAARLFADTGFASSRRILHTALAGRNAPGQRDGKVTSLRRSGSRFAGRQDPEREDRYFFARLERSGHLVLDRGYAPKIRDDRRYILFGHVGK